MTRSKAGASREADAGSGPAAEVDRVYQALRTLAPHVTFSVDRDQGEVVVRVFDPVTKEVVRQIPPEELIEIRRRLDDYLGTLTNEIP